MQSSKNHFSESLNAFVQNVDSTQILCFLHKVWQPKSGGEYLQTSPFFSFYWWEYFRVLVHVEHLISLFSKILFIFFNYRYQIKMSNIMMRRLQTMSEWTQIIIVNLMLIMMLYTTSIGLVFYQRWYLKVSTRNYSHIFFVTYSACVLIMFL